jgi:hypothetical protein
MIERLATSEEHRVAARLRLTPRALKRYYDGWRRSAFVSNDTSVMGSPLCVHAATGLAFGSAPG